MFQWTHFPFSTNPLNKREKFVKGKLGEPLQALPERRRPCEMFIMPSWVKRGLNKPPLLFVEPKLS
jgi:hypothetical protein